jgi:hypothetical protein
MFVFEKNFIPLVKRLHTTHLHHTLKNIIILSLYFVNYNFAKFFKKSLFQHKMKKITFPPLKSGIICSKIKMRAEARRKGEKVKKPQPVALSISIRRLLIKVRFGKIFLLSISIKITAGPDFVSNFH